MDRSFRQYIYKEAAYLNNTIGQMDLTDIFSTFHPRATAYTFFQHTHGTFSRIDLILVHKRSLNKFKKSTSSIFSDHNDMKLEINNRRKVG